MTDVVTLLAAVSANGTGPVFNAGDLKGHLTVEVFTAGTVSAFSVQLQGSLDGTDWVSIGSPVTSVTAADVSTGALMRLFRAVLSGYSGSGTVTAYLALAAGAGGGSTAGLATSAALSAETSRAEAAEAVLTAAVSAETARAESAETALTSAAAAETSRAEAAEAAAAAATTAETTRAEAAEAVLTAAISVLASTSQSGSYTLAATDQGTVVEVSSSSAVTVTIPPHSSAAFPAGALLEVCATGTGQVTIAAGAGVTLRSAGSLVNIQSQYATAGLRQRAVNDWVLTGALA